MFALACPLIDCESQVASVLYWLYHQALEKVGMARVLVAANVASEGRVQVIVQNLGSAAVDIEPGVLRVSISQYG